MLYLTATPIGNLEDISLRALRVFRECDYILAEDTRKALVLLRHFKIQKKVLKFEKFSEKKREARVLADLQGGKNIVLISDAGTPLISDPGESLVRGCIARNLKFTALPGSCSVINALVLSGMVSSIFQFRGFLKRKDSERRLQLLQILSYGGTSVVFETAPRLLKTLEQIYELDPGRELAVAREMSKKFEEVRRGTVSDLIGYFSRCSPKGELVLIVKEREFPLEDLKLEELLKILREKFALSNKEALKKASKILKRKKSELYKQANAKNPG